MSHSYRYKRPVTHAEALTAIAKARAAHTAERPVMDEDVAFTLRCLVLQFFRPSGNLGEFADRELSTVYAADFNEEPMEVELDALSEAIRNRNSIIGPVTEDNTPTDYSVTVLADAPRTGSYHVAPSPNEPQAVACPD